MKKFIAVVAILFCVSNVSFAKEKLSRSDFNLGELGVRVEKVENELKDLKKQVIDLTKKVEQKAEDKKAEKVENKPVVKENPFDFNKTERIVKDKPKKFFNNKKAYGEVYKDVEAGKKAVVYVGVEHDGFDDYTWTRVDALDGIKPGVYDCYLENGNQYMKKREVKPVSSAEPTSNCPNGNCPSPSFNSGGCPNGNCPSPSQQYKPRLFRW